MGVAPRNGEEGVCVGEGVCICSVSLTREVEEGIEDVKALHVIPLDELVGVIVEDFGPGEGAWSCTPC